MIVSEGISGSGNHPDSSHCSSTFLGYPDRGGWRPLIALCQTDDENIVFHFIIDWRCPSCKKLTSQSRTCPHCGLAQLEQPVEMRERARRDKLDKFKSWIESELFPDEEDDDASRVQRKRGVSQAKH
jgi:hypothetical protein